jgi:hypothetical protein
MKIIDSSKLQEKDESDTSPAVPEGQERLRFLFVLFSKN